MRIVAALALLATLLAGPTAGAPQDEWPTERWPIGSPGRLELGPLTRLAASVDSGSYGYIDRIFVVRNGYVVFDRRYQRDYVAASRDYDLADHQYDYQHPDFHPFYQGRPVHTLQSVTKSITSLLIGIAIDNGAIAGIEAPVAPFFDGYRIDAGDERKARIRLVDVLTMRSGIEWHETDRPFGPTNTTIQLEASDDWIQFVWDQPMDADPGTKWVYNSGASQLLSGIIKTTTGQHVQTYAEVNLFAPLGIDDYYWKTTPDGYADTEGGLYLRAEDLARIGYLVLHDGRWNGSQVVSEEWITESTRRHVDDVAPGRSNDDRGYGYKWWRLDQDDTEIIAGLGYGGQFLLIVRSCDLVAVSNAWNVFESRRSILRPLARALTQACSAKPQ